MNAPTSLLEQTYRSPTFLTGTLVLIVSSLLLFFVLTGQFSEYSVLESQFQQAELTKEVAKVASPNLQTRNVISLNLQLKRLVERPDVIRGSISDVNGEVLTEFADANLTSDVQGLVVNEQISLDDNLLGYLSLEFADSSLNQPDYGVLLILLSAISLGVWFFAAMVIVNQQNQHLHQFNQLAQKHLGLQASSWQQWQQHFSGALAHPFSAMGELTRRYSTEFQSEFTTKAQQPFVAGQFAEGCILSLNITAMVPVTQEFSGDQIEHWLHQQHSFLHQVATLYGGEVCQDQQCLVFSSHSGITNDNEQATVNALCAAQVLQLLHQQMPEHSPPVAISLASGEFWLGSNHQFPANLQVFGPVVDALQFMHLHNPGEHILLADNLFQQARVNELVDAEIHRDLILPNGERLEVWQLNTMKENYPALLSNQAQQLLDATQTDS